MNRSNNNNNKLKAALLKGKNKFNLTSKEVINGLQMVINRVRVRKTYKKLRFHIQVQIIRSKV